MTKVRFECPDHGMPPDEELLEMTDEVAAILGINAEFHDLCMREVIMGTLIAAFAYNEFLEGKVLETKDENYSLGIDTMLEEAKRLGKLRHAQMVQRFAADEPKN